ncbi:hypothetical protein D9M71_475330 [compost metagenome]
MLRLRFRSVLRTVPSKRIRSISACSALTNRRHLAGSAISSDTRLFCSTVSRNWQMPVGMSPSTPTLILRQNAPRVSGLRTPEIIGPALVLLRHHGASAWRRETRIVSGPIYRMGHLWRRGALPRSLEIAIWTPEISLPYNPALPRQPTA